MEGVICKSSHVIFSISKGVSLKTQEMYALVFVTRYLDIFWNFSSLYNTIMKLVFLATSFAIIYFMRFKYRHSYDKYAPPPAQPAFIWWPYHSVRVEWKISPHSINVLPLHGFGTHHFMF
jgi:hypothetical protein